MTEDSLIWKYQIYVKMKNHYFHHSKYLKKIEYFESKKIARYIAKTNFYTNFFIINKPRRFYFKFR